MENHAITPEEAPTIPEVFRERVKRSPDAVAYRYFDDGGQWREITWRQVADEVARWQSAFLKEGLQAGDKVALMLRNSPSWVVFDQAALSLGLVTVPVYIDDRPDNVAYILNHAEVKLLAVQENEQWKALLACSTPLEYVQRIVSLEAPGESDRAADKRLAAADEWLKGADEAPQTRACQPESLASIVYTSGTTGRPKGVMLSHKNFLSNAWASIQCAPVGSDDVFLSFLPLSHTLERTAGYLLPLMIGAQVAYARSVPQLAEDLVTIRPTVLISVPRIYERVYGKIKDGLKEKPPLAQKLFGLAVDVGWARFEHEQGRAPWSSKLLLWPLLDKLVASKVLEKLGGRLRIAICGGAPLSSDVARLFIGLGLPLIQGYGLTEFSPVISVNRLDDNIPSSIGTPLPGVEVRIGEDDELQARGDSVMLGYWKNEEATREVITEDGWLRTGDKARIDPDGHLYITGRLKDIIVLATGEKVPPADMEMAIALDGLFEQVVVIGEGRPYLSALVVLNPEHWAVLAREMGVNPEDPGCLCEHKVTKVVLDRLARCIKDFPGYAQIRSVTLYLDPWTVENGFLTPTLKIKRSRVMEACAEDIEAMYAGH